METEDLVEEQEVAQVSERGVERNAAADRAQALDHIFDKLGVENRTAAAARALASAGAPPADGHTA